MLAQSFDKNMQLVVLDTHKIMLENYIFQNVHHKRIKEVEYLLKELLLPICHCFQ
jgi:hypothetical protein